MKSNRAVSAASAHYKRRTAKIVHKAPCLKLGDAGFYYFHEFRFELIYLKLLRK
jgi:hypothetical protein